MTAGGSVTVLPAWLFGEMVTAVPTPSPGRDAHRTGRGFPSVAVGGGVYATLLGARTSNAPSRKRGLAARVVAGRMALWARPGMSLGFSAS